MTDLADLAARVYAASYLTGHFRLCSGQVSDEYFDKYRFESDPGLLGDLAVALAPLVPAGVEALAGLELGGVPLAVALSARTGLPARFVRKEAKDYGTENLAEGGPVEGLTVAVVEDVITSGGQVRASCADLRARGAEIAAVLCVVDRQSGGAQALADDGLELRALFTGDRLRAAAAAH